jgi:hypothetical protein
MDFGSWVQSWLNVLTRPGEPAFEEERIKPHADLSTAAIWIAVAALISGLFALIGGAIAVRQFNAMGGFEGLLGQFNLPPDVMSQIPAGVPFFGAPGTGIGALIGAIIWSIIGYLIFVAILQLVAKVLGGTGNFGKYAYLIATFHVPITIANAILGIIPLLGGCLVLILSIYEIVLAFYATRVEHKLPPGKAIVVVLAPVLLILLAFCCIVFAGASLFAGLYNYTVR